MKTQIKTAFDYIRRTPFQALASISVLFITFFVATLLGVIVYSSSRVLNYFETRPQIIAFLKSETSKESISTLQKKLSSDERVKDINFVSKEQALEIYKKATSDNPLLGELVNPSVFPSSIEFSVTNLSFANEVINEIKKEEIVESVGFTASLGSESNLNGVVDKLRSISHFIKISGIVFVSSLVITSFLVLLVVISMRITTRRDEIEILELIGATSGFIRAPILIEAFIYVLIGVSLGWLTSSLMILYATPQVISFFGEIPVLPKDTIRFLGVLLSIFSLELITGLIIAFTGTLIAIGRAQKN